MNPVRKMSAEDLQKKEDTYEFSEGTRKQIMHAAKGMKHIVPLFERALVQTNRPIMHYVISRAVMEEILLEIERYERDTQVIRQNLRGPGYHKKYPYNQITSERLPTEGVD
jgi:hypothetical protein